MGETMTLELHYLPVKLGHVSSRKSMMTSSNGTFSTSLALCVVNSPVTGEFPSQKPVTRSFDVFFHLSLNKRLSKQLKRRWFETPSRSLWRHWNAWFKPMLIKWPPWDVVLMLKVQSSNTCYRLSSWSFLWNLLSCEFHRTPLISQ